MAKQTNSFVTDGRRTDLWLCSIRGDAVSCGANEHFVLHCIVQSFSRQYQADDCSDNFPLITMMTTLLQLTK